MRRAACVLLGLVVALPAVAAGAEGAYERIYDKLERDESMEINLLDMDGPVVHEITCNGMRLTIRVTPDGLMQIQGPDVLVSIEGSEGGRADLALGAEERISVWPVRRLTIRGGAAGFSVGATAADWAFVVRADQAPEGGIGVICDGIQCNLMTGGRLDADREGDRVVFREIAQEWPGFVVGTQKPTTGPGGEVAHGGREGRPGEPSAAPAGPVAMVLPLVATGWAAWEVQTAPPVSP